MGLGLDLCKRGVKVILVEKRKQIHTIPKGQNLTQRTCEHFKFWGVAEKIQKSLHIPSEYGIAGMTTYGSLLGDYNFEWYKRRSVNGYYSADNLRIPQYETEIALKQKLNTFECSEIYCGYEAVGLTERDDKVELDIIDQYGETVHLTGKFLIGCDGTHSTTRQLANIPQKVVDHEKRMVLTVFDSPELDCLSDKIKGKSFFHIVRPELEGYWKFFGRVNLKGGWFYHSPIPADTTKENFDASQQLYEAVGKEFNFKICYQGFWDIKYALAETFQQGRIVLAGDAAHGHPPYGGYGINTGLEDARNLGWKLAAYLQGWGSENLLETYTVERREIFISTLKTFIDRLITDDKEFINKFNPAWDKAEFEKGWNQFARVANADVGLYCPSYAGSKLIPGTEKATMSAAGQHRYEAHSGEHLSPTTLSDGTSAIAELGNNFSVIFVGLDNEIVQAIQKRILAQDAPVKFIVTDKNESTAKWDASIIIVRPDHYVAYASQKIPVNIGKIMEQSIGGAGLI